MACPYPRSRWTANRRSAASIRMTYAVVPSTDPGVQSSRTTEPSLEPPAGSTVRPGTYMMYARCMSDQSCAASSQKRRTSSTVGARYRGDTSMLSSTTSTRAAGSAPCSRTASSSTAMWLV